MVAVPNFTIKVLILGASGMLGHKAYQILSPHFDTYPAFKNFNDPLRQLNIFAEKKIIDKVNAFDFQSVTRAIDFVNPDIILNCIGIIKQLKEASNPKISIYTNALFPHLLEEICAARNCKLIHISTDCVFSGSRGNYKEEDMSDAIDLYGRTKYLGEVIHSDYALTLRTSIIGRELFTQNGLVEWFLSQNHGKVNGYSHAIYTGLTTVALCKEIRRILIEYPNLNGLYHVSSDKISKYELLKLIADIYGLDIEILPYENFHCDRSLNSSLYRETTGFFPPSWQEMIQEMFQDPTPYHARRER
ncbi:MAG: SDR family oxidoreductase [Nitrospirota bacterium]